MIAAIKNISFIGTNKNYEAIQMVNFALGFIYLLLSIGSMVAIMIYFF